MAGHEELVSYLWDVCSAELLCKSLEEEIADLQQETAHCQAALDRKPLEAKKPRRRNYRPDAGVILFIMLGLLSLALLLLLSLSPVKKLFVLGMAGFWLCGAAEIWQEEQGKLDRIFRKETDAYESACQYNAGLQADALRQEAKMEENSQKQECLNQYLEEAKALCGMLYEQGQIPADFRSCTAACYLYLNFATTCAADLEKLLLDLRPGTVRSFMEDYLCPDWENMLTCRWEQALWERNQGEEGEDPLHKRLNELLLTVEY